MNGISDKVQEQVSAMIRGDQQGAKQNSSLVNSSCVFNGEVHINVYITQEKGSTPKQTDEQK